MSCKHEHIHPARVDGHHSSCLDCGAHIVVQTCQYASGLTPEEDARKMRAQCEEATSSRSPAVRPGLVEGESPTLLVRLTPAFAARLRELAEREGQTVETFSVLALMQGANRYARGA